MTFMNYKMNDASTLSHDDSKELDQYIGLFLYSSPIQKEANVLV